MTLVEVLENSAKNYPHKKALIFEKGKITYQELQTQVSKLSSRLLQLGVEKGSKVGILLKNCPEFIISYFAVLKAGGTIVPLNFLLKEEEIKFILDNGQISMIITSSEYMPMVHRLKLRLESLEQIIAIGSPRKNFPRGEPSKEAIDFSELLHNPLVDSPTLEIDEEDTSTIIYTSGTTGHPKGVMLTHKNLISNVISCLKAIQVTKKDNFSCFLPMFHSFTWTVCVLLPLYIGATVVIVESIRAFGKVVKSIVRNRVTIFVAIPPVYNVLSNISLPWLLRSPLLRILNPLRICISGAASLPMEVLKNFEAKFHLPLLEGYGLTEASPVVSINPLTGIRKPGSVGLPLPQVEIKVVDEQDQALPPNKPGELLVKGDNVMAGYYDLPEETQSTIKEGWLYTGDLAKIDEEGYIYIVDRKKDMIIVRGQNVYPREIEEVFYQNPVIAEACVIGIKDKLKGEVPKAYVVLKESQTITEGELINFLKERLASYKIPRTIEFRNSLPKNPSGKIQKRLLRPAATPTDVGTTG